MIYLSVEPTIRTVIRSPPANEIDSATRVWGFLCQEYDSAFTIFGRRIHLEPTRRSPGIGRNRRSDLGYHRRLPLSFRAVPRSFDIVADDHDYNRCADSAASIIYVSYEPTIRAVIRSPLANEIYSAARVCEFLRQGYDSTFTVSGRIDT